MPKRELATFEGIVHSADFEPVDDDGNPLDGMLLTIRVPNETLIWPGPVSISYLPMPLSKQGEGS